MIKLLLKVVILSCAASVAFAGSLQASNPHKPIIIGEGSTFVIVLKSNPTTGYRWLLQSYVPELLEPVSQKFRPNTNKKLIGAPGYALWTFKLKAPAKAVPTIMRVTFRYARPWLLQSKQQQTFTIVTR